MKQERLKTEWEGYREACVPTNAGPEQIKAAKCAFYGGALVLYGLLMSEVEHSPTDEPTEANLTLMSDLHDELTAFSAALPGRETE